MSQRQWGVQTTKPGAPKQHVAAAKLAAFTGGQQKKSRFELEREQREIKRKREEVAAAEVYEEFVASFEGHGARSAPRFVQGASHQSANAGRSAAGHHGQQQQEQRQQQQQEQQQQQQRWQQQQQ